MKSKLTLVTIFAFVFIAGFIVGCGEETPDVGSGDPRSPSSIELRIPQTLINGVSGEFRTQQITAVVKNANGVGIPGVRLSFGIRDPQSWKGSIATTVADSVSNDFGEISATYSVVLGQAGDVVVEARVGQVVGQGTIQLRTRSNLGNLSLAVLRNVLSVAPGRTRQTSITATLVDSEGLAIPGVQVKFGTMDPTMGYVDSDTATTDFSGRATRMFTNVVNKYGIVEVFARVGEGDNASTATAMIEIREVSGPANITLLGPIASSDTIFVARGVNHMFPCTAYVVDAEGVGVPNTTVGFSLVPYEVGGTIFGHLAPRDTTNEEGVIINSFQTLGKTGTQWIVATILPTQFGDEEASVRGDFNKLDRGHRIVVKSGNKVMGVSEEGAIESRLLVTFAQFDSEVGSFTLFANPGFMDLPPDSVGQSLIRAVARNANGNPLRNLEIRFTSSHGTVTNSAYTDSLGVAMALFSVHPSTDFSDLDQTVAIDITGTIRVTNDSKATTVTVKPLRSDRGTLELTSDTRFIYADNGLTVATLTATLKNEEGQVLPGQNITFSSNYGVVNPVVTTDSLGLAVAIFRDTGIPSKNANGDPDSAVVIARFSPMGVQAIMRIMIREQNPVDRISISSARASMPAGRGDTTTVRATCILADGNPAPNGTQVHFEARLGSFTQIVTAVMGDFGATETQYVAGNVVGVDTLQAYVIIPGEVETRVYSPEIYIQLVPGNPNSVVLDANPRTLLTNDPDAFSAITATVTDTAGNKVRPGTLVQFTADRGTVTPSAITDDDGIAYATLRPGVEAGISTVTGTIAGIGGGPNITGNVTVTFISGSANSIELEATPLEIQVAGTGGQQFSTLRATLRDANGNVVENPTMVIFELINEPNAPEGANINNRGRIDSSRTSNGIAVATVNSGTQIGSKLIRAYTWRDAETRLDTVSINLSTLAVVSGPPSSLDIDINTEGLDAGGGVWAIEISARVWDSYRNPVADRIPVMFTVDPQIATASPGHTGNIGRSGNAQKGLAYSTMLYNSNNTFDPVEITAEVQTVFGLITGRKEVKLPLQGGVLSLQVDPANWMFEDNEREARIRVWAVLVDGHGIEINNAPILFISNRARFYWFDYRRNRDEMFYPAPARKFTGVVNQEHSEAPGHATVYLKARMNNIFLDPFTPEVTVQIDASVEGYNDVSSDPSFVYFTRFGEGYGD